MKKVSYRTITLSVVFSLLCLACNPSASSQDKVQSIKQTVNKDADHDPLLYSDKCISEREVVEAQKIWGAGIVRIGKVFSENGDYSKEAADFCIPSSGTTKRCLKKRPYNSLSKRI